MPDCMDRLHRRQMTGAMHVDRRINSHVGIGSREQDFEGVECNSLHACQVMLENQT